ncbi:indolepyruvate ferredoxin oxidoreductase subunit alpha [Caldicellulosiruptoraceae bacterium PP1]
MKKLMLGNEAVARGCYEASVKVVSSYPGTPSTEITEYIAKYDDIYSEWAPNEKVALEVAIGASIYGKRALSCMKHVGLNVAADPLFTVSYTGINKGLVLAVADDPGMHSSQNEQDTRMIAKAAKVPIVEPSDSDECRRFVKFAFKLSEMYDTPVILRLTTRVSHSQSIVELEDREDYQSEYIKDISKYVMMPAMARKRHIFVEEREKLLSEFANNCELNRIEKGDTSFGIITSGISYQYVKEAIPNAWILKLGLVNPLPQKLIKDFCNKFEKVYIIEELDPFIENYVRSLGITNVHGKDIFPLCGEYSAQLIKKVILGVEDNKCDKLSIELPIRTPVLCPGCPHRGIFYAIKKVGTITTGDIGCYTLGALKPFEAIDTCVCMGASIGMAHGINKASDNNEKAVAVIGDSTFIHSGITGLINAVYNKSNLLLIILDNSTTGMTGHQEHPATGFTIKNEPTYMLNIVELCKTVGVDNVDVIDPYNINENVEKIKKSLETKGVSVLIAKAPCRLHKRFRIDKKIRQVDNKKCKNCKMCLSIGCPAISNKDGIIKIDENLCFSCGLCQSVCKFGAIITKE